MVMSSFEILIKKSPAPGSEVKRKKENIKDSILNKSTTNLFYTMAWDIFNPTNIK